MIKIMAYIILGISCLSVFIILIRKPTSLMKFIGNGVIRAIIGVLLLFFVNVFGQEFGLHIPINVFTVLISAILGLFGIAALLMIHIFIF